MNKVIWIALTFLAGAFLPIQAGLNSKLGKAVESPVYAAFFSFLVGTVAIAVYILFTRQTLSWHGVKEAPVYIWFGGLLGAFYVTLIIFAFPALGPGVTFCLIVAGQMLMSLVLEHYNILVVQQNPISYMKLLGMTLVIIGVIIIRKF